MQQCDDCIVTIVYQVHVRVLGVRARVVYTGTTVQYSSTLDVERLLYDSPRLRQPQRFISFTTTTNQILARN